MATLQRAPLPALAPFVATLWTNDRAAGLPHAREWNLPTGCADLVIALQGVPPTRLAGPGDAVGRRFLHGVLQGVRDSATLRSTQGACTVVGVQFTPLGLAGFWAAPAQHFSGQALCLDDLWPGFADRLREQVHAVRGLHSADVRLHCLEQALLARLRPAARPDGRMAWAQQALAGGAAVGDVQRRSGLSPVAFIAAYRAACGLAPKRHADVLRLQQVLRGAHQGAGWAALAADAGYADQSHLSRQFTRLAGMTPGQYRRGATAWPSHVVSD
jgi:AraC-like DNA-binding protein